jgi:hypothetical protein
MKKAGPAVAMLLWSAPAMAACPAGQHAMVTARLYFGLTENAKPIADSAWTDFLARSVTPRFPSGFTVYEALGQWRDPRTRIIGREPSRVVEIDAPDTRDLRDRIAAVRAEYKTRFHQQSVGLLTLPACGTF